MAADKTQLADEVRNVAGSLAVERLKDSEWEAAFDRHLKHTKSRRVLPSKRSSLANQHTADAGARTTASYNDEPSLVKTEHPSPEQAAPRRTSAGPSLLHRLGGLSTSVTSSRTLVERAGVTPSPSSASLSSRIQGSSKDLDSPPEPRSDFSRRSGVEERLSSTGADRAFRPRDTWESSHSERDYDRHRTPDTAQARGSAFLRSRHRYDDDDDFERYRRDSRHDRSGHPRRSPSRSFDYSPDVGGASGNSTSKTLVKPRDVWEAPARVRRNSDHRTSHSDHGSHQLLSPRVPDVKPSSTQVHDVREEDRESASGSQQSGHWRKSAYGGPLPSPPHVSASDRAPAPFKLAPQPPPPPPPRPPQLLASARPPVPCKAEPGTSESSVRPEGVSSRSKPQLEPVRLPNELPYDPRDPNFVAWPPPSAVASASDGSDAKSKQRDGAVRRYAPPPEVAAAQGSAVADPRRKLIEEGRYGKRGRKKEVKELHVFHYERDNNSVGPLPPTAVFVSGFPERLHGDRIYDKFFKKYGKIVHTEAGLDSQIGTKMPFLYVSFAHDYTPFGKVGPHIAPGLTPQNGIEITRRVIKEMNGFQMRELASEPISTLKVQADDEKATRFRAACATETWRRQLERVQKEERPHFDGMSQARLPMTTLTAAESFYQSATTSPVRTKDELVRGPDVHAGQQPSHRQNGPWGSAPESRPHSWAAPPPPAPRWNHGGPFPPNGAGNAGHDAAHLPSGSRTTRQEQQPVRTEAWQPGPPAVRVGRLGGIPPTSTSATSSLPTDEILRRLADYGRAYFRWDKGGRKHKFSDIKAMFNGMANILFLEHDETHFYCCLKSQSLSDHHRTMPVRHLRSGDRIELQYCPAPRVPPGPRPRPSSGVVDTARQATETVLNHLTDELVSSAKHHAERQIQDIVRNVMPAAPAVDAMALLASTTSIPSAPTRTVPLPQIRRREHISDEEREENDSHLRPSKVRRVSNRSLRDHREDADSRADSLEPNGRSLGKISSPSNAPTQATPTESTHVGDSDDDDVGDVKDDETQTTEEIDNGGASDDEDAKVDKAIRTSTVSRGVKRTLQDIFSSDEDEGNHTHDKHHRNRSHGSDSEDDDEAVSQSLLTFKSPIKSSKTMKAKAGKKPGARDATEDVLTSMLLDTVASIEAPEVHEVTLSDDWPDDQSVMDVPRKQPPKAAAKANKKAKKGILTDAMMHKGKAAPKTRPDVVDVSPPTLSVENEVAIVVTQADELDSVMDNTTEAGAESIGNDGPAQSRKSDPRTKKGRRERLRSPSPDPFALNFAQNEEDLYFLRLACERLRDALGVGEDDVPDLGEDETLPAHSSGAARTEGYYKIPASQKAAHLPDRNQAVVEVPVGGRPSGTARGNRAESRRVLMNIELHKKESATDTDILKFNQLSARKKQLKFAKSPIHDWGLYAMELIPAGDMVIEYVGEVIRQQVADEREKRYERQGQYSTYLFRVDDELVVDATMKGNIARLMNHCCTPNCNAKILTVNGEKRIALFAKSTIYPGQELTYDYKFQSTGDAADQIACLCGSAHCRKFL